MTPTAVLILLGAKPQMHLWLVRGLSGLPPLHSQPSGSLHSRCMSPTHTPSPPHTHSDLPVPLTVPPILPNLSPSFPSRLIFCSLHRQRKGKNLQLPPSPPPSSAPPLQRGSRQPASPPHLFDHQLRRQSSLLMRPLWGSVLPAPPSQQAEGSPREHDSPSARGGTSTLSAWARPAGPVA